MFFALVIAGCFFQAIQAIPVISDPVSPCSEIRVRKEWRDLTVSERQGYIDAVLCLQTIPPKDPTSVALTRYEEFQATHIELTERIHTVGQFLPWHRHLVTLYGDALREDCGYEGPLAFWDWSRDADSEKPMAEWPIFDETLGFGGDGVAGTYTFPPDPQNISAILFPEAWKGCVQTGPFKDLTIHLGPGKLRTSHCLIRGFGEDHWRPVLRTSNLDRTLAESDTFKVFHLNIDSLIDGVHSGGHGIIGGEMINVYSAGVDPLFYLHHANLDRVWWLWQRANPDTRLYEIGGYTTQTGNTPITLDFVMDFPGIGGNVTVRDVMDNTLAPSCFTYEY